MDLLFHPKTMEERQFSWSKRLLNYNSCPNIADLHPIHVQNYLFFHLAASWSVSYLATTHMWVSDYYFVLACDAPVLNGISYAASECKKARKVLKKRQTEGHENTWVSDGEMQTFFLLGRECSRLKTNKKQNPKEPPQNQTKPTSVSEEKIIWNHRINQTGKDLWDYRVQPMT